MLPVPHISVWRGSMGTGKRRRRRRRRVEPTDDWEQLELLCAWDEQREYERIRPLVLFGEPLPERAWQTGTSERTLYRRISGFEQQTSPLNVQRIGGVTMAENPVSTRPPLARKP